MKASKSSKMTWMTMFQLVPSQSRTRRWRNSEARDQGISGGGAFELISKLEHPLEIACVARRHSSIRRSGAMLFPKAEEGSISESSYTSTRLPEIWCRSSASAKISVA